jgi:hypothetical protein
MGADERRHAAKVAQQSRITSIPEDEIPVDTADTSDLRRRQLSFGKRIYRSLMGKRERSGGGGTSNNSSSGSSDASPHDTSPERAQGVNSPRRHSYSATASYYAQRMAKNLLVGTTANTGSGQQRRRNRTGPTAMPQPPAQFFEPDRINVVVPWNQPAEIYHVRHHLK